MGSVGLARLAMLAALAGCGGRGTVRTPAGAPVAARGRPPACCRDAGERVARTYRVAAITQRRFTHAELWRALDPIVGSPAFRVDEVGRSLNGRAIRTVSYGTGPTTVLLWSQMHGDESTATMALADILAFFAATSPDPADAALRDRLRRALTIVMVPMLNPDGAERFQRENAVGVDVNRDARRLATPEAQTLKGLHTRLHPDFGFNLHDQGARTLAGPRGPQTAIALLAPPTDERGDYNATRARARLVAATIASVLAPIIPTRVARYDDTFNPRAFGDLMQQWGTSTVLIESEVLPGDPEKQRLREINVVAILTALDAIATDRLREAEPAAYETLPVNSSATHDLLVLGGQLVLGATPPMRVDLGFRYDDLAGRAGARLREVGDLAEFTALDTIDARGLFVHPEPGMLDTRDGGVYLRLGAPAALVIRRGASAESEVVRTVGGR